MTSSNKRKHMDVYKLMMSDYKVEMADDAGTDFYVDFSGPKDTAYEGGKWQVHVNLPPQYPFRSPSVGFKNRIFHPNVDFRSGTICLDVINQTWSPMFDLLNIFDTFLPQLLAYPNPADPLNNEAAAMLLNDPEKYNSRVREHVKLYATFTESSTDSIENEESKHNIPVKKDAGTGEMPTETGAAGFSLASDRQGLVASSFATNLSTSAESQQDHHVMDLDTMHGDTDASDDEEYSIDVTEGFDLAV